MKPMLASKPRSADSVSEVRTTMEQVLTAEKALNALGMQKMSMKSSYTVARMMDAVEAEGRAFRKVNDAAISELGEVRPSTVKERALGAANTVTAVKPEHEEEYRRRLAEFHQQEVVIARAPISLSSLKAGCPACNEERVIDLEPSIIKALGPFVTE